ncbi:MAG: type III-A CRISPR-associated protein Cas10/Csm1 [Desulfuromusa sp.]|nr:type III-A CRISPR-associated protein Cas10/Csm1 [Desulfuromusa sp.]
MTKSGLQQLVLAALLHDIGKFTQRAEGGKSSDQEDMYCPVGDKGYATHTHVLYTDYFIENELPLPPELEPHRSKLARLAAAHHKPAGDDGLELAIQGGDRLSAGTDRISGEAEDGNYKKARLVSIFDQINLRKEMNWDEISEDKRHYHSLRPIDDVEAAFPVNRDEAGKIDYATLYNQFQADLQELPLDFGVDHYIASITSLLEKYTWCIPSSTYRTMPDIPLYDHSTTTAALAQVLAVYKEETGIAYGEKKSTEKKFLLVGGDLSGIQKYIFGIDKSHAAGVAKMFRARSFYIQMITHTVIIDLLKKLQLHPVAKIMDAGGRFILLVPAAPRIKAALHDFEYELQQWFYTQFYGVISLNFSYQVELTEADLQQNKFGDGLDRFNDHLEERKLHKFDRLFAQRQSPVMAMESGDYSNNGVCQLCQIQPASVAAAQRYAQKNHDKELAICPACQSLIDDIGTELPKKDYLIFQKSEADTSPLPLFGGLEMKFVKLPENKNQKNAVDILNLKQRGKFHYHAVAGHLPTISDGDISHWNHIGILNKKGDSYYYKDDLVEKEKPKTFQLLAETACGIGTKDQDKHGKSLLGAFKADVDNLGFIFSIGLGHRISISRFASLSRMISHFFSNHLVQRIKEKNSKFRDIYLVFAGGDDLFLLGPWIQVIEFAEQIGAEFRRYVADNKDVTLSAGISVVKPLLPMHTIADEADKLLEESKERKNKRGDEVKNGITLFDVTTDWNKFSVLLAQGDEYFDLLEEGKVTTGLIGRLLKYSRMYQNFNQGDIRSGIYLSHMEYDFHRNLKFKDDNERDNFTAVKHKDNLEHIAQPVTYALYRWRSDH